MSSVARTCGIGGGIAVFIIGTAVLIGVFAPPDDLAEFPPLSPRVSSDQRLLVQTPEHLALAFEEAGYDLKAIRSGNETVPHLLLREWPDGFEAMKKTERKKTLFIQTLLPLILHVNQSIAAQRAALRGIIRRKQAGRPPSHRELAWIDSLAMLYRTTPDKTAILFRRIAPVPPSLAIAQAAAETGWGTSRFARQGNALFGQWTFDKDEGLKPKDAAPDARHAVKQYDRLLESAWDYARNLNTNRAYRLLRLSRAKGVTGGAALAGHLIKYSERGPAYVRLLRRIIAQNKLGPFDKAKLQGTTGD